MRNAVAIDLPDVVLQGDLTMPKGADGLVIFAHGSGSSRLSPRNRYVAERINAECLGTLLMDLLSVDEERVDEYTREFRFDISMLAMRVAHVVRWARSQPIISSMNVGLFGSSTGAAAALMAAADLPDEVQAVVSRGGRPDLAGHFLPRVKCPTLLIVGGEDAGVITLNEEARNDMHCEVKLTIVPGATHLFEESGALETVATLAAEWFSKKLRTTDESAAIRHW